jgi:biotin-(acetyl-CoA carboxylase) ligase
VEFHLKFNIPEAIPKISFSDKLIFFGSCFSDEISLLAKQHGFQVVSNPFGTLFHPLALAQNILDSLRGNEEVIIAQNNDVYLDYNCSGKVYSMSELELKEKVSSIRKEFKNDLKIASYLFITFGTAFAYHLNETQQIVGNCHRQSAQSFTKRLTKIEEIVSKWNEVVSEIMRFNPKIQICFTVSPVRHLKDGLHQNNLSKSTLHLAINQLLSESNLTYFPSFELVNDVLRDYRFFKEDLTHPNQQAIQFVWQKFMSTFLTSEIQEIANKVSELKQAMNHRIQYLDSKMAQEFQMKIDERKELLKIENPSIFWD